MAQVDDLLAQVSDDKLRLRLLSAVAEIRRRKKFGLVYEAHIPEVVCLATEAGLRVGAQVMRRRVVTDKSRYTVTKVSSGKATLSNGTSTVIEKIADLLVVKPFGEPVYPVLRQVGRAIARDEKKPFHTVINGENFHALQLLLLGYQGLIDCIYIDPPYNTGDRSWKYNNDFVDKNDAWQHSKWLSMMERRLNLARKLLSPNGVLIVTIDEHEVAHLGVLLEELFPDARRQMVTIVNNAAGISQGGFYRVEEYAYFCFLGTSAPQPISDDLLSDEFKVQKTTLWFSMTRYGGINALPSKRSGLVYPIAIDPERMRIVGTGPTLKERVTQGKVSGALDDWRPQLDETVDGYPVVWPFRVDGSISTWQLNPQALMKLAAEGFVRVREHDNGPGGNRWSLSYIKAGNRQKIISGAIPNRGREPDKGPFLVGFASREVIPKTVWRRASHDAGKWGSRTLRELLGSVTFDYAKSPYAVRDALATILINKPNALVLDFFAGSGTTLHAVAMLNASQGGQRRCVLVTNNQVDEGDTARLHESGHFVGDTAFEAHGVCRAVTEPRIRAALSGRRKGKPLKGEYIGGRAIAQGFEENAVFFDLAYEDADRIEIGDRFESILPSLWLAAGAIGDPSHLKAGADWFIQEGIPFAVLLDEDRLVAFLKVIAVRAELTHVWLVTDSEPAFARMRQRVSQSLVTGMLYRDYLRNFRVNAAVGG